MSKERRTNQDLKTSLWSLGRGMVSAHLASRGKSSSSCQICTSWNQSRATPPGLVQLQICHIETAHGEESQQNLLVLRSFFLIFAGFLTETGKTRASVILSTGTESAFQVTQIRIKVGLCSLNSSCFENVVCFLRSVLLLGHPFRTVGCAGGECQIT